MASIISVNSPIVDSPHAKYCKTSHFIWVVPYNMLSDIIFELREYKHRL